VELKEMMFRKEEDKKQGSHLIKFPHIILGEIHSDPICSKILTKLIPKLKEFGYTYFFDERTEQIETILEYIDRKALEYKKYENEFKKFGLEFSKENAIEFYSNFLLKSSLGFMLYSVFYSEIHYLTTFIKALLAEKEFLLTLKESSITYQPIDIIPEPAGIFFSELEIAARDKAMAKVYSQTISPVFGRIGIAHFSGLHSHLASNCGVSNADNNFCFFHVYTKKGQNFEKIPSSVIKIDANLKKEEEIVEEILKIVCNKRPNEIYKQIQHMVEIQRSPSVSINGSLGSNYHYR
jgi:hypothetical protein